MIVNKERDYSLKSFSWRHRHCYLGWIRDWCEVDHHPELSGLPQSPGDVLRWLIFKIGDCGEILTIHFILSSLTVEKKTGVEVTCSSSQKMCEVGQRLYDEELQHSFVMEND